MSVKTNTYAKEKLAQVSQAKPKKANQKDTYTH